ncbi:hypothetical protein F4Z99_17400 [Candidatus Poribacteria bacterium]|nr:hypothetical protein [Candidatus Poribacteria bacterium]
MNTSELTIDELFALIRHAARQITYVSPDNEEKNRDIIEGHTSRINNLLEALEERDGQEAQAFLNDRKSKRGS